MIRWLAIWLFFIGCAGEADPATLNFPDAKTDLTLTLLIADSQSERAKGLMFMDEIAESEGMWFIFDDDGYLSFWMKNVKFSIDILFIDSNFVIKKIWSSIKPCMEDPCETYQSGFKARYALEVKSGFCLRHGIEENQRVQYLP